jgi:general secretion pathway protein C
LTLARDLAYDALVPAMAFLRRHRLATELALLALVAYLAASGVSIALRTRFATLPPAPAAAASAAPAAAAPAPLAEYAVIAERDVFNPAGARTGVATSDRHPALRLWGVAYSGATARAVIEDVAAHRQDLFGVGDRIGESRIASIDWDRVTLDGPGGEQTLALVSPGAAVGDGPPPPPAAPPAGAAPDDRIRQTAENAFVVDRRALAGAVDNMSGLLTQLRAVAEVRDGRPAGFRLFQIREGSLFSRLGLRNGDVVQRVNGGTIADPTALLGFLQRLGQEPRVALDIVRADTPRTLVYDLR